jgi:hypothetical protein
LQIEVESDEDAPSDCQASAEHCQTFQLRLAFRTRPCGQDEAQSEIDFINKQFKYQE